MDGIQYRLFNVNTVQIALRRCSLYISDDFELSDFGGKKKSVRERKCQFADESGSISQMEDD